ncbi:uncharacterized protein LOC122025147 isoform X2 [Zingiber officinale]|uniref:Uncharacterized protein n=2 Tax=Zingiber officinale TaxID=94328 RepID=A0A8J5I9U2_ZINOF|nr:uncharacterized protein LOC122025147 isoform X2 [Zingiber officinale]KAG6536380.1 hypothetical protein ZIOFF_001434 [Zingiber officinale]
MGGVTSKCFVSSNKELRATILLLEEEIEKSKSVRQQEAWDYGRRTAEFAAKEEEWVRERRSLAEEALEQEAAQRTRRLKKCESEGGDDEEWWCLVESMKEEQRQREGAVERWKKLYLTIKTELDDLIQRTSEGERFSSGSEERMVEQLQKELRESEKEIESLRSRVAVMQKDAIRKDTEIDILRQSLRILSVRNSKRSLIREFLREELVDM